MSRSDDIAVSLVGSYSYLSDLSRVCACLQVITTIPLAFSDWMKLSVVRELPGHVNAASTTPLTPPDIPDYVLSFSGKSRLWTGP